MNRNNNLLICVLLVTALGSCKIPTQLQRKAIPPIPKQYDDTGKIDSSGSATIPWREFFKDTFLVRLIDTALANNWDIEIAIQRIEQAKSNTLLTKGMTRPFTNGVLIPGVSRFGDFTMDGAGNKNTEIYKGNNIPVHLPDILVGVQTNWEIDAWKKLNNKSKAATARYYASAEGKNMVVTSLVASIASAYYELLWYDESLRIIDTSISIQGKALEIIKTQKQAAAATELGVRQFEIQLSALQAMRLELLGQIAEQENQVNLLSGKYPAPVLRNPLWKEENSILSIRAGIPSELLQHRPDIRQAEYEMIASKADFQTAKASFYPNLSISAGLGVQAFRPDLLVNPSSIAYNIAGNLAAPILNKSAIKAEFQRADAAEVEAIYNYQKTVMAAFFEVIAEMKRLANLQAIKEQLEQGIILANQGVEISNLLFRSNRANYLEVLFAQQNAIEAKMHLAEIMKESYLAAIFLYKSLGGGWR